MAPIITIRIRLGKGKRLGNAKSKGVTRHPRTHAPTLHACLVPTHPANPTHTNTQPNNQTSRQTNNSEGQGGRSIQETRRPLRVATLHSATLQHCNVTSTDMHPLKRLNRHNVICSCVPAFLPACLQIDPHLMPLLVCFDSLEDNGFVYCNRTRRSRIILGRVPSVRESE